MSTIVDRRQNPKEKSLGSRQKFLKRAREQVKKAVSDSIANTNVKDFGRGKVNVPIRGISEPTFQHDSNTGRRRAVIPGNKDYVEGDTIEKPNGGQGRGTQASDGGDGEDDFSFTLTPEEYVQFFFDDLELPNLVEKELKDMLKTAPKRAGYTNSGNPANLSVSQTMKKAIGRRIALSRPKQEEIDALLEELTTTFDQNLADEILAEIAELERRMRGVPYIDKMDLKYRNTIQVPKPNTAAVMIALMDVSGSMMEREKEIAKVFFILLFLLLHKKYEKVEIVFVRHHHEAEECDENDFFHKQESGGTVVSEGLRVVNEVADRYPSNQWNIYVAQASDGDNWSTDASKCTSELEKLLPRVQYFTYLDIPSNYGGIQQSTSELWDMFVAIREEYENVAMAMAADKTDVWRALSDLYKKAVS